MTRKQPLYPLFSLVPLIMSSPIPLTPHLSLLLLSLFERLKHSIWERKTSLARALVLIPIPSTL